MSLPPNDPATPSHAAAVCLAACRWLSSEGGRASARAATLRLMDSSGLVRGTDWCPGQADSAAAAAAAAAEESAAVSVAPQHAATATAEGAAGAAAKASGTADRHSHASASSAPDGAATSSSGSAADLGPASSSGREGAAPAAAASAAAGAPARQAQAAAGSTPLPRKQQRKLWRVAMGEDGTLEGFPRPAAASGQLQERLAAAVGVGDGAGASGRAWEPSACDVELLLAARGAGFEAVIGAADELRRRWGRWEVSWGWRGGGGAFEAVSGAADELRRRWGWREGARTRGGRAAARFA